ncbi:hypothetical protein [Pedobacter aquatilis]|uniref:hypothetical protein n=1 Tax=Pedobacter aquatilis TaxID=351343 RepID=UPI00292EF916|nr:hypothetical protein [Pedobacter aquatilis]
MIKITSTLTQLNGFTTNEAVLEITNYTTSETVQLVTGSTSPMALPTAGKSLVINYSLYKSEQDKADSMQPFIAQSMPWNYTASVTSDDEITESFVYNLVKSKLNEAGINTVFL